MQAALRRRAQWRAGGVHATQPVTLCLRQQRHNRLVPGAGRRAGQFSTAEYDEYVRQLIDKAGLNPSTDDVATLAQITGLQASEQAGSTSAAPDGADEDFWSDEKERVYLVGVSSKSEQKSKYSYTVEESLEELGRLADTAGLKVVGSTYQQLETPNVSTYIGGGKVLQVAQAVQAYNVETVVFDDELSPGQLRNLAKAFSSGEREVRVCDRTALILDIFQQRAQTREGQLQVELASIEYQLPRLTRMWTHLDRVGGGGQVKGTGEKQIEIDKRLLRDKAAALRRELESVRTHRRLYRGRRMEAPIPVVAIVGYTNAGKSTLLNTITDAGVLAEDKLFATLDPTTRKVRLRGNKEVLMSDTVGFIQKLPTQLVAAFRATLEEIKDASVVLHVVDISHENAAGQCQAVLQVLDELGIEEGMPVITAWNKIDACANPTEVRAIAARRKDTVCISGRTGEGIDDLLETIGRALERAMVEVDVLLPYSCGALLDDVHTAGRVKDVQYEADGTRVKAFVPQSIAKRLQEYL